MGTEVKINKEKSSSNEKDEELVDLSAIESWMSRRLEAYDRQSKQGQLIIKKTARAKKRVAKDLNLTIRMIKPYKELEAEILERNQRVNATLSSTKRTHKQRRARFQQEVSALEDLEGVLDSKTKEVGTKTSALHNGWSDWSLAASLAEVYLRKKTAALTGHWQRWWQVNPVLNIWLGKESRVHDLLYARASLAGMSEEVNALAEFRAELEAYRDENYKTILDLPASISAPISPTESVHSDKDPSETPQETVELTNRPAEQQIPTMKELQESRHQRADGFDEIHVRMLRRLRSSVRQCDNLHREILEKQQIRERLKSLAHELHTVLDESLDAAIESATSEASRPLEPLLQRIKALSPSERLYVRKALHVETAADVKATSALVSALASSGGTVNPYSKDMENKFDHSILDKAVTTVLDAAYETDIREPGVPYFEGSFKTALQEAMLQTVEAATAISTSSQNNGTKVSGLPSGLMGTVDEIPSILSSLSEPPDSAPATQQPQFVDNSNVDKIVTRSRLPTLVPLSVEYDADKPLPPSQLLHLGTSPRPPPGSPRAKSSRPTTRGNASNAGNTQTPVLSPTVNAKKRVPAFWDQKVRPVARVYELSHQRLSPALQNLEEYVSNMDVDCESLNSTEKYTDTLQEINSLLDSISPSVREYWMSSQNARLTTNHDRKETELGTNTKNSHSDTNQDRLFVETVEESLEKQTFMSSLLAMRSLQAATAMATADSLNVLVNTAQRIGPAVSANGKYAVSESLTALTAELLARPQTIIPDGDNVSVDLLRAHGLLQRTIARFSSNRAALDRWATSTSLEKFHNARLTLNASIESFENRVSSDISKDDKSPNDNHFTGVSLDTSSITEKVLEQFPLSSSPSPKKDNSTAVTCPSISADSPLKLNDSMVTTASTIAPVHPSTFIASSLANLLPPDAIGGANAMLLRQLNSILRGDLIHLSFIVDSVSPTEAAEITAKTSAAIAEANEDTNGNSFSGMNAKELEDATGVLIILLRHLVNKSEQRIWRIRLPLATIATNLEVYPLSLLSAILEDKSSDLFSAAVSLVSPASAMNYNTNSTSVLNTDSSQKTVSTQGSRSTRRETLQMARSATGATRLDELLSRVDAAHFSAESVTDAADGTNGTQGEEDAQAAADAALFQRLLRSVNLEVIDPVYLDDVTAAISEAKSKGLSTDSIDPVSKGWLPPIVNTSRSNQSGRHRTTSIDIVTETYPLSRVATLRGRRGELLATSFLCSS